MINKYHSHQPHGRSFTTSNPDGSEQFAVDYLSDNTALLTVTGAKGKQVQVMANAETMRALRDSLNLRYS